jgi:flagellar L-ring protein precursor FlgH
MKRAFAIAAVLAFCVAAQSVLADNLYNEYRKKVSALTGDSGVLLSPMEDSPGVPPVPIKERDLVTVIVEERAIGSGTSASSTSKNTEADLTVDKWFQIQKGWKTSIPTTLPEADVSAEWKAEGAGKVDRRSLLQAKVKVMVMQVYPNGNLLIEGRSTVTIGDETNQVVVTGVIRSKDVNTRMEITSTNVYDLRVVYNGTGMVTDAANPGWLTKFITKFWPF